jgi:two-component system response regulator FixJ
MLLSSTCTNATIPAGRNRVGMCMSDKRHVYVVDDDSMIRRSLVFYLSTMGYDARPYVGGSDFLDDAPTLAPGCVVLDVRMPELDGLQVLQALGPRLAQFSVIVMTGHGDVATAVAAMKLGATDFIEKPYAEEPLLATLERCFAQLNEQSAALRERDEARAALARLSPREREVLDGLISGLPNKLIAQQLDLSVRTVEMHRARMMERLDVKSIGDALRLAYRAT